MWNVGGFRAKREGRALLARYFDGGCVGRRLVLKSIVPAKSCVKRAQFASFTWRGIWLVGTNRQSSEHNEHCKW
mgnify:CR=1 FL=1